MAMKRIFCPFCREHAVFLAHPGHLDCGHDVPLHRVEASHAIQNAFSEIDERVQELLSQGLTTAQALIQYRDELRQYYKEMDAFEASLAPVPLTGI